MSTTPSPPAQACPSSPCGGIVRGFITVLACGVLSAPPALAQSRGELLYTTHCISCHTTEMHWRDKRSANNWAGLMVQVRRWQDAASLAWSEADIVEVSRYLNDNVYHFEPPAAPAPLSSRTGKAPVTTLSRLVPRRNP